MGIVDKSIQLVAVALLLSFGPAIGPTEQDNNYADVSTSHIEHALCQISLSLVRERTGFYEQKQAVPQNNFLQNGPGTDKTAKKRLVVVEVVRWEYFLPVLPGDGLHVL